MSPGPVAEFGDTGACSLYRGDFDHFNRVQRFVSRVCRFEDSSGFFNMCRFMALGALRVACC